VAKRGFGSQTATWSALLAALMPFQIYHAQELRMYTLLAVGVLVYLYGVMDLVLHKPDRPAPARESSRIRGVNLSSAGMLGALACIAIGTTIALYAHNLAFVSLLAGNVFLLVRRAWRAQAQLILGQIAGAVFFTPWLLYV